MADQRLQATVPDGERLEYATEVRRSGGAVGITDERLLVVDGDTTSVAFQSIEEVAARDVDWFLAVLSVAIVGVGLRAGLDDAIGGGVLVAAGVVSLYVVYRKRGKVTVSVSGRGKPLQFYIDDTDEFLEELEVRLARFEDRLVDEVVED